MAVCEVVAVDVAAKPPPTVGVAPRVPGWPLVGPVADVHRNLLGVYERAHRECGDVARLVTGIPPLRQTVHLVMHPDGVRHVLAARSRDYGKDSPTYEEIRAYLGRGLLTSQDADWERQKRLVQPLFTPRRVAGYAGVIAEEAARLAEDWQREARAGRPVDLHAASLTYTMRVVGRLLFGEALDDVLDVVQGSFEPMQHHMLFRGLAPVRLPRDWPTPGARRTARHQQALYASVDAVIARAASRPDPGRQDLLTLLLAARDPADGSPLSLDEVRDQVLVFLLAGHETSAGGLTFALWLLGRHPDEQQRVREEARSGPGGPLPYTRQVVEEAMRLYPPACHIPRSARRDDTVLGRRIAAGDDVLLPTWVVHRDGRWWPDPLRFDPDRFATGRQAGRHRYAYLPFGGGPRACIGAQLALVEMTLAVAALVGAFELRTRAGLPPLFPGVTLRPRGPVLATLRPAPHAQR